MLKNTTVLILCVMMASCTSNVKNISTKELIKSREIRKVSEVEILQAGMMLGNRVEQEMKEIIVQASFDSLICSFPNPDLFKSLAASNNIDIRMAAPNTTGLSELETGLLEAYQYNFENGLVLDPSIQKNNNKEVLYVCPVTNDSLKSFCAPAHQNQVQVWLIDLRIKDIINQL